MKKNSLLWRWFFVVAALEAGAAFAALWAVPRESASFSIFRVALLAGLLGAAALFAVLAVRVPRRVAAFERTGWILAFCFVVVLAGTALFLLRYLDPEMLLPFYQRLSIPIACILIIGIELCLLLLVQRFGLHRDTVLPLVGDGRPSAFSFGALLILAAFIALTRLGVTVDSAYWGEPGVPILGWQLVLAVLLGLLTLVILLRLPPTRWRDTVIAAAIWLAAVTVWLSVPNSVMRNSFYAPINPPSGMPFPNSDAGYYDSMAESLLIGHPYQGEIPTRPLYILLLTVLHVLFGERYDLIIAGQTLVLGLIPVLLYLLAKELHSRPAGLAVAFLAIFRELNSLLVSSQTRVSNTKTLLVDLPTLLLILATCYLTVRWLAQRDVLGAAVAGGSFGMLLLLRTQAGVIVPIVLVIVVLTFGFRSRAWLLPSLVFVGFLVLTVLPWLLHNYVTEGRFAFDASFQTRIILSQYRYSGNLDITDPGLQSKSLLAAVVAFTLKDPRYVLGFVANHALATQVGGILALPLIERYDGLLTPLNLYWLRWDGHVSAANLALIILYLSIIGVGLGAAWSRFRWRGLLPLAFSIGYSVANGLGRFSGWRYDLPADWVWYFYLGLGAFEILGVFAVLFGADPATIFRSGDTSPNMNSGHPRLLVVAATFIMLGSLPWLAAGISPPRYGNDSSTALVAALSQSASVKEALGGSVSVAELVNQPNMLAQRGRVLYPRYFPRNVGLESAHPWPAYAARDFARIGFLLLNKRRRDVVLATRQPPPDLVQAADVIVLGCQREDYIEARVILIPGTGHVLAIADVEAPCQ